jgi:hypothetical protein
MHNPSPDDSTSKADSSWFYMVKFAERRCSQNLRARNALQICVGNCSAERGSFASLKNSVALRQKLGHGGTGKKHNRIVWHSMTTDDFPTPMKSGLALTHPVLVSGPFWPGHSPVAHLSATSNFRFLVASGSFNNKQMAEQAGSQWWKTMENHYLHQQATGTFLRHTLTIADMFSLVQRPVTQKTRRTNSYEVCLRVKPCELHRTSERSGNTCQETVQRPTWIGFISYTMFLDVYIIYTFLWCIPWLLHPIWDAKWKHICLALRDA